MKDLYDKMLNIANKDIKQEIENAIKETKEEYKNLTTERTCHIYTSIIYEKLKEKQIPTKIVNTKELQIDYEHYFLLVTENKENKYLIDLTYNQFNPKKLETLKEKGYIKIDTKMLLEYLNQINESTNKKGKRK